MYAFRHGYTLIELVVVCAVLAITAAVVVPGLAATHGRAAVPSVAARFAVVLRDAQARAWAGGAPVRVSLTASGDGYVVDRVDPGTRPLATGTFGGVSCDTNFPGDCVEFVPAGFPHASGGPARAGTFTFSFGGVTRRVVVQMGGAVRCP